MLKKLFLLFLSFLFCSSYAFSFSFEWDRVYLTTFPRSGNHWLRYLVEEASGIATSSAYVDKDPPSHMPRVFPWGGHCAKLGYERNRRYPLKGERVLVKTHHPRDNLRVNRFEALPYIKAFRVVRNPVDSIYSLYVWRTHEKNLKDVVPTSFVKRIVKFWRIYQEFWNESDNVITFRYEDMLKDPFPGLKKICTILRYRVTDRDIARAIKRYPADGKPYKHIDKFKKEDLKYISDQLSDLLEMFGYEIPLTS